MAVLTPAELVGRTYPSLPPYQVGRAKIAEFATAVGADDPAHHDPGAARALGYADVVAPPTFAAVLWLRSDELLMSDPEAGLDFSRLVHGAQRFTHHRPIVAGDELTTTLTVDTARDVGGHLMISTRTEMVAADGAPVCTAVSTVVIRGADA